MTVPRLNSSTTAMTSSNTSVLTLFLGALAIGVAEAGPPSSKEPSSKGGYEKDALTFPEPESP